MKEKFKPIVLSVLIIIAVLFSAYAALAFKNNNILNYYDDSNVYSFNNNWVFVDKQGNLQTLNLPVRLGAKSEKTSTISNTLPSDFKDGMMLCFRSVAQSIRVKLDENEIYTYGTDKSLFFGKSPGAVWNLIKIPDGSQGKIVTLVLESSYEAFKGYVNPITYGYKNAIFVKILGDNFFSLITSIIMFLFGIGFLILYLVNKFVNNKSSNLIYLACYVILNSIWIFFQSKLVQFVIGNQSLVSNIIFSSLVLSTIAMFLFISEVCINRNKKVFNAMYLFFILSFLITVALQTFKIADIFETIGLFHAALFVSCFVSGYALCVEFIKYKNKTIQPIVFSVFVIIVFTLIEIISYSFNAFDNISIYSKFGCILLLLYLTVIYIKKVMATIRETNEAKYFEKLAYIDMLTQSKNRNAFNLEFDLISKNLNDQSNIFIVMFDLNKLKFINDNFGHIAGDSALTACYNCISHAFYPSQKIYRIGGDEFVCILEDAFEEDVLEKINIFKKCKAEHNKKSPYPYSIAYGYAKYDQIIDNNINDTLNRADKRMYENKKENKELEKNQI